MSPGRYVGWSCCSPLDHNFQSIGSEKCHIKENPWPRESEKLYPPMKHQLAGIVELLPAQKCLELMVIDCRESLRVLRRDSPTHQRAIRHKSPELDDLLFTHKWEKVARWARTYGVNRWVFLSGADPWQLALSGWFEWLVMELQNLQLP